MKGIFITDLEGPLSKNDNAFELAKNYIPDGDKFFSLVSKYDDVLADVFHRPNYKAGDTLRLILPFLKAYGVTSKEMEEYSSESILLVPKAKETIKTVRSWMPSFIVSTSYEQYVKAVCDWLEFPFENAFCTRVNIDKYEMDEIEKEKVKKWSREIVKMPMIQIPRNAKSLKDFSKRDQKTIERLDEIFFEEIPKMKCGKMLEEVNPIGGYEKAEAVKMITENMNANFSNVIYFGDSITDVESFKLVKDNGGVSISFNGNQYAIREAEIAVLSKDTFPILTLSHAFKRKGKEGVFEYVEKWDEMFGESDLCPKVLPQIKVINDENKEKLAEESSVFRKTVRGEAIGKLG